MNNSVLELYKLELVPERKFFINSVPSRDLFASQLGIRQDSMTRAIRIISQCPEDISLEELESRTLAINPTYTGVYDHPTLLGVVRDTKKGQRKTYIVLGGHHRIAAAKLFSKSIEVVLYESDFNIGTRYGINSDYTDKIKSSNHPSALLLNQIPYLVNFSVITNPFKEV